MYPLGLQGLQDVVKTPKEKKTGQRKFQRVKENNAQGHVTFGINNILTDT